MDEQSQDVESARPSAAALKEQWRQELAEQQEWWRRSTAALEEEFIRQNNLTYGGLIAIGVVLVQPFLTAGADGLGLPAKICVIALSVAVPLLAALLLLNRHETHRRRLADTRLVQVARSVALGSGFTGVVAGFWHILPAAGITVLACGLIGTFVHASGYTQLELRQAKAEQESGQPEEPQPPEA